MNGELSRIAGLRVTDDTASAVLVAAETGDLVRVPVTLEPVLTLRDSGESTLGTPANTIDDTVSGFAGRVGDPAGVVSAHGISLRAEDLVATALFLLLRGFANPDGSLPAAVAVHPQSWSAQQISTLREAMDFTGLSGVVLVADTPAVRSAADDPTDPLAAVVGAARSVAAASAAAATRGAASAVDPATDTFEPIASSGPVTAYADAATPAATSVPSADASARNTRERRRTAMLVGAVVVAGMLLTAGIVGVLTRSSSDTPVPPIENASGPQTSSAPTTTRTTSIDPVTFPTVDANAPVAAPRVTTTVDAPAPAPPPVEPPPPAETVPPIVTLPTLTTTPTPTTTTDEPVDTAPPETTDETTETSETPTVAVSPAARGVPLG